MTFMKNLAFVTTALALGMAAPAFAADRTWQPTSPQTSVDWATGGNWSGGVAPGSGDRAIFNSSADVEFTSNIPAGLTEIQLNNNAKVKLLQSIARTIPTVTVNDTAELTVGPGFSLTVSTAASVIGSMIIDGVFLPQVAVTVDGTLSISNGAQVTFPSQNLNGTGTLDNAGQLIVSGSGMCSLSSTLTITDYIGSQMIVLDTAELRFNNDYPSLNADIYVQVSTNRKIDVQSHDVETQGSFYPTDPASPCDNVDRTTGSFIWVNDDPGTAADANPNLAPC
jgi:hypothetical protein